MRFFLTSSWRSEIHRCQARYRYRPRSVCTSCYVHYRNVETAMRFTIDKCGSSSGMRTTSAKSWRNRSNGRRQSRRSLTIRFPLLSRTLRELTITHGPIHACLPQTHVSSPSLTRGVRQTLTIYWGKWAVYFIGDFRRYGRATLLACRQRAHNSPVHIPAQSRKMISAFWNLDPIDGMITRNVLHVRHIPIVRDRNDSFDEDRRGLRYEDFCVRVVARHGLDPLGEVNVRAQPGELIPEILCQDSQQSHGPCGCRILVRWKSSA